MAGLNLFTNNAATTLASGINSSVTSLTVASSTGGLFPSPTGSQYFYCTLSNSTGTVIEIVKVTARSTDTFTIVRAQDNTTAQSFSTGDKVELRATAADLNNFGQLDSTNTWAGAQTFSAAPIMATLSGLLKGNGASAVGLAAAGTDYLAPPSGTALLKANSGGALANAAAGTDYTSPTGTETLTNKRVTPRVNADTSNSATPSINTDTTDINVITGQSNAITSMTTNLTGTPTNGQKLWIAITGTTAIAITWGASFESSTATLPTTTVSTTRLDIGFVWNAATSKWRCVASA
jgi:hypothetical protein